MTSRVVHGIGTLNWRLIEGVMANKLPAMIPFIDIRKVFDTIHRDRSKMLKILHAYGIPRQIVTAVENTKTT